MAAETATSADRLVHHSTIFERHKFESYCGKAAARQQQEQRANDNQPEEPQP